MSIAEWSSSREYAKRIHPFQRANYECIFQNELGALLSLSDRRNINQDTVSTIKAACEQMAEQIVEQSKNWDIRSEDSQEMLDEIRGKKIY